MGVGVGVGGAVGLSVGGAVGGSVSAGAGVGAGGRVVGPGVRVGRSVGASVGPTVGAAGGGVKTKSVPLGNGPKLTAGTGLALAGGDARPNVAAAEGRAEGESDGRFSSVAGTERSGIGVGVGVCDGVSKSPLAPKMAAATSSASMTRLMAASGLNVRGCR